MKNSNRILKKYMKILGVIDEYLDNYSLIEGVGDYLFTVRYVYADSVIQHAVLAGGKGIEPDGKPLGVIIGIPEDVAEDMYLDEVILYIVGQDVSKKYADNRDIIENLWKKIFELHRSSREDLNDNNNGKLRALIK